MRAESRAESIDDDLLAAVERVMEERGFAGATAESIARAAGVSRVTLYRRGLTREGLIGMAALRAAGEFREASLAPLTHAGSGRERLDLLLVALFDLADRHLALLAGLYDGPTALFHLGGDGEGGASALTRFEYTEPFARVLRDGEVDGSLASADPDEDAELIFNTAGWTYVHLRRSHGWAVRRARPAVARIATAFVVPVT